MVSVNCSLGSCPRAGHSWCAKARHAFCQQCLATRRMHCAVLEVRYQMVLLSWREMHVLKAQWPDIQFRGDCRMGSDETTGEVPCPLLPSHVTTRRCARLWQLR